MGFFDRKKEKASGAGNGGGDDPYRLGLACEDSDPERAKGYYEESYAEGNWPAGFRLARLEVLGDGDMENAVSILASAFETLDDDVFEGSLDCMHDIGMAMFYGEGIPDSGIAVQLLERCADLGHGPSLEFLRKIGLR